MKERTTKHSQTQLSPEQDNGVRLNHFIDWT